MNYIIRLAVLYHLIIFRSYIIPFLAVLYHLIIFRSYIIPFLAVLYHLIIYRSYIIPFLAALYHPDAVLYQSYIDLSSVAIVYPYRPWYISFAVYHYYLYNTFSCIICIISFAV